MSEHPDYFPSPEGKWFAMQCSGAGTGWKGDYVDFLPKKMLKNLDSGGWIEDDEENKDLPPLIASWNNVNGAIVNGRKVIYFASHYDGLGYSRVKCYDPETGTIFLHYP